MKIRILSDLHLDVNKDHDFSSSSEEQKEMFTVLCGDTSGHPAITHKWIRNNMKRGVFVAGNHLVYNWQKKTIEALREQMAEGHGLEDAVTYLDCMIKSKTFYKKVEGILFVGTTLYTDFLLPLPNDRKGILGKDEDVRTVNKRISEYSLNDYTWGRASDGNGHWGPLSPNDYQLAFEKSFGMIKELLDKMLLEEPDTPVVMVTHHCPSPKCIDSIYVDSELNATYVSDLEPFILSHPNIKLWCCGHVHHQDVIKVGECQIVMNPRGYLSHLEDKDFCSFLWIDTDDWSIHKTEKTEEEKRDYEVRREKFMRASAWFI